MAESDSTASKVGPKQNRRSFIRLGVPFGERLSSLVVVLLIGAVGIAIWWKGKHYDPGQYVLRTEALNSTVAAPEDKVSTPKAGTDAGNEPNSAALAAGAKPAGQKNASMEEPAEEEGVHAPGAPTPVKGEPLEISIPGLKPMSATEFYGPENLFEKIDGRAPAYLDFSFQQLRCRTFEVTGGGGSFVDVFEYRMDSPANAFGIFSMERDPKGKPLEFAPDGYSGEMGFFFRQGACYVQVIASDQKPKTIELATALAQNRAKSLSVDNAGLDARKRLPNTGLIASTVQFIRENAQGQPFLKDVFQATYNLGDTKVPFFIMITKPDEAAAGWAAYRAFAEKFGKLTALPDIEGAKVFQVETFGTWKVVYQRAGELGGVYDAGDAEKARQFVEKYLQGRLQ